MAGGNELEPNDSRNVTGTAQTPDGRWSGDKSGPGHGGELEPADSRNVTGTASTPDGRWTNDQGNGSGNAGTDYSTSVADFSQSEVGPDPVDRQPEGGDGDSIEPSHIPGTAKTSMSPARSALAAAAERPPSPTR